MILKIAKINENLIANTLLFILSHSLFNLFCQKIQLKTIHIFYNRSLLTRYLKILFFFLSQSTELIISFLFLTEKLPSSQSRSFQPDGNYFYTNNNSESLIISSIFFSSIPATSAI